MPQSLTLRSSLDAWTSPDRPSSRFGDTRLYAHSTARTFQFFNKPRMVEGTVVISATLRLFPDPSTGGSGTVDVALHPLTSALDPNALTWANQPSVGAAIQTVTRPSWFNNGAAIEFNVTSLMQAVINGGPWFGFRVSSTEVDSSQSFGGSQSTRPPEIVIEYTTPPQPPVDLRPSSNSTVSDPKPTLSWTTPGGMQATQTHVQIQVATNNTFSSGLWTSAEIATGASSFDLDNASSPSFTALTNGAARWWRVRIKNDYGSWSAYSSPAQFTYSDPQVANITAPGATTADPSPTITWTYTGTQAAWQIVVEERAPLTGATIWIPVYDSGFQYTTSMSFDLPVGIINYADRLYRIRLRVWNSGEAVSLTGAPLYSEDIQEVDWNPAGATPPTDLELVDILPGRPGKFLRWRYTGPTASYFIVYMWRNGKAETFDYLASSAREGSSEWYRADFWLAGRTDIHFNILTVMPNNTTSTWESGPALDIHLDHRMPWVVSVQDPSNRHFCLLNATVDPGLSEISDLVQPVGGAPFLATYAFNKFNGKASGIISDDALPGLLTAQNMKEDFLWIRENPQVFFSWADQAIQAYIYNTAFTPVPNADGSTDYLVSFDFVQV